MTFFSALLAADAAKAAPHAAPAAAHGAAEAHGPVADIMNLFGSFGVDLPHLIVQLVNFSLLAFVVYRFAVKPALGQMEERNRLIEKGLADAQALDGLGRVEGLGPRARARAGRPLLRWRGDGRTA